LSHAIILLGSHVIPFESFRVILSDSHPITV
jgi:hypothetical protein